MQLAKSIQVIEALSEFDDFFKTSNTECWIAPSGSINLYLFSTVYDTSKELQEKYKELRDHVAISFQSRTLINSAERWNLYLLYLVKEQVSEDVKQMVLQDKFSARKMVYSTGDIPITDELVNYQIAKSLLDIEIPQRAPVSDKLEQLIKTDHPRVATAMASIGLMLNRNNMASLIKILSDD